MKCAIASDIYEHVFKKKFKKDFGEINPLGVHKNVRGSILEINCEGLGW